MPELPEVETIRSDLYKTIKTKKIVNIKVFKKHMIKGNIHKIKNWQIEDIKRRGKLLIIKLTSLQPACRTGRANKQASKSPLNKAQQINQLISKTNSLYLLAHLGMTGQIILSKQSSIIRNWSRLAGRNLISKHTYCIITLSDKSKLYFNDIRMFGYLQLTNQKQLNQILNKNYGIEPLTPNYTWENFQQVFSNRKTSVKNILLNQKLIAGIGNIYADEICFFAKILPSHSASTLTPLELKQLFIGCEKILKLSIQHRGTSFSDYRDASGKKGNFLQLLQVYQRANKKCLRCKKGIIQKIKISGRSSHYCPLCQS
jgi:formamidopyrimidine-DNA glycosylase